VTTPERLQSITEAIRELSDYRLLHKEAWLARNKQGGFEKSYRRLENLMQLLNLLAHNLSEVKNDRTE
jgi:flagellar biosynthesis chaperone FliJ